MKHDEEIARLKDENEQWEDAFNFFVADTAASIGEKIDKTSIPREGTENGYRVIYMAMGRLNMLVDRYNQYESAIEAARLYLKTGTPFARAALEDRLERLE